MSAYKDSRGFIKITHREMKFDEHNKSYPSEIIGRGKKAYAYLSYIPWDHCTSTLVYFVTAKNGDEYGQYKSAEEALAVLKEIES